MNVYYVLMIIVALGIAGVLIWNHRYSTEAKAERARRDLLLNRAEGRISKEEFEDRQAALNSVLVHKHLDGSGLIIAVTVIGAGVATAAVFAWLGSRATVDPIPSSRMRLPGITTPSSGDQVPQKAGGDLRGLAKPLAEKLAAKPDDGAGWLLLARTYLELHQFKEAEAAFEKASKLVTADAQMLVDWADARVSANNSTWTPAALDMLKTALALDPKNLKGLALAAGEADSRNDTRQAEIYRRRISKLDSAKSLEVEWISKDRRRTASSAALPVLPTNRGN